MASLSKQGNGWRVYFDGEDGRRKAIWVGVMPKAAAEEVRVRIGWLVSHRTTRTAPSPELSAWLRDIADKLHGRLAAVGLVEARERRLAVTVRELCDRYMASTTVSPGTVAAYRQGVASLVEGFGEDRDIKAITAEDADRWRRRLAESRLAVATQAKRVAIAQGIFRQAVRWGLVPTSPLEGVRAGSQVNPKRLHYVDRETFDRVLAACPDDHWRAILGLVRLAGLRCPSELVGLTWDCVDWHHGRLRVAAPKTDSFRFVPVDPELRVILHRLFDAAEPGTTSILPGLLDSSNLRTRTLRILATAGVTPWPRLLHNLRGSVATDWASRYPLNTVARWLGHSIQVAARHYLSLKDEHFDDAAGLGEPASVRPSVRKCAETSVRRSVARGVASTGGDSQPKAAPGVVATACESSRSVARGGNGRYRIRTCDHRSVTAALCH